MTASRRSRRTSLRGSSSTASSLPSSFSRRRASRCTFEDDDTTFRDCSTRSASRAASSRRGRCSSPSSSGRSSSCPSSRRSRASSSTRRARRASSGRPRGHPPLAATSALSRSRASRCAPRTTWPLRCSAPRSSSPSRSSWSRCLWTTVVQQDVVVHTTSGAALPVATSAMSSHRVLKMVVVFLQTPCCRCRPPGGCRRGSRWPPVQTRFLSVVRPHGDLVRLYNSTTT
mmetsp:Transcript_12801/g.51342  ORF Transcript_12801/g.51342 Transcript_12801/m.51342 type:complete len:229 (-) Transcript_12801:1143-1829(-)